MSRPAGERSGVRIRLELERDHPVDRLGVARGDAQADGGLPFLERHRLAIRQAPRRRTGLESAGSESTRWAQSSTCTYTVSSRRLVTPQGRGGMGPPRVPRMLSYRSSQRPMPRNRSACSGWIVPSGRGPTSRSRFAFRPAALIRSRTSSGTDSSARSVRLNPHELPIVSAVSKGAESGPESFGYPAHDEIAFDITCARASG